MIIKWGVIIVNVAVGEVIQSLSGVKEDAIV